jgi:hypothetical protein
MREVKLYGTTDASGDLTVNSTENAIFGYLYAVRWIDGTFENGVDAVLSTVNHDAAATLLTLTDANDDAWYYPRSLVHDESGAALTGTAGGDRALPLVCGELKLVVSSGGNKLSGGCIVFIDEV